MAFHTFVKDQGGWVTHEREPLFVHRYLEVDRVVLSSPSRETPFEWTVCHRKAGVVVAAQTPEGGFVVVRQERIPVRATLWEFPAGQIDEAGPHDVEMIVAAGLRELSEEAGFEPGSNGAVISMHHYLSSPGFTDEHVYQLWVTNAVPTVRGVHPDVNEAITDVRVFSWTELQQLVASGEIRDSNTLCSIARIGAMRAMETVSKH